MIWRYGNQGGVVAYSQRKAGAIPNLAIKESIDDFKLS